MADFHTNTPTFSFVVPVYNEQDGLENFYARLTAAAEDLGESYEIVFINDGSEDNSEEILRKFASDDPRVRVVSFSRNFGHQLAITAGYDFAIGQAVISLDGDCQHPPEKIVDLVERWREGFEVVYTVRKDTEGISFIRRVMGRAVYRLMSAVSGVNLTDQADFRLLDRKAVDAIKQHREHARLLRGLTRWVGFRQTSVTYVAEKRSSGASSYTLGQLLSMAGAGVFNFSLRPLRLAGLLGGVMLAAAFAYAIGSILLWPFGIFPGATMHLLAFVVGLFGTQFVLMGILGEYVGRIFEEAKARPLYIVREKIGFTESDFAVAPTSQSADQPQRYTVFT